MVTEVSVLIPVYNYGIFSLVQELRSQCARTALTYEIICLDDASDETYQSQNRAVSQLEHVVYEELSYNISRAAVRNALAQRARFAYLLFLDNDSENISPAFIQNYLREAQPEQVLVGGTVYTGRLPALAYRLHWRVGRHREQKPAAVRNQQPYRMQLNNFFISRNLYEQLPLSETITTYGHEDSQWGKRLERARVAVKHIDNPVRHAGLESASIYLTKTEQAIQNLHQLYFTEAVGAGTPLVRWYLRLARYQLKYPVYLLLKAAKPVLLNNLRGAQPSLFCFDLYKLALFLQVDLRAK